VAKYAETPASDYLTTAQAAEYLNISKQYLEAKRSRRDGSGPSPIFVGRAVRYHRGTLDQWMKANEATSMPCGKLGSE